MARIIYIVTLALLVCPRPAAALMEDYCTAPPYTTRTISPNIMILLDNSCDMLNPAYDHSVAYSDADAYSGYFMSNAYYTYDQNRFQVVQQNVTDTAYYKLNVTIGSETFRVVYKGNFLNYITMSRFDLLQRILTGGNAAVPRQAGGAATVKSFSGQSCGGTATQWDWTDSAAGCKYVIDNGELKIQDEFSGSCIILNAVLARNDSGGKQMFFANLNRRIYDVASRISRPFKKAAGYVAKLFDRISLVREAYAAVFSVTINTTTPLPAGIINVDYSQTFEATASSGTTPYSYTWTHVSGTLPTGLTFDSGVLSGKPTVMGTYYFTIRVDARDSKSPTPRTTSTQKEFALTISDLPAYSVTITESTLPSAMVNVPFGIAEPHALIGSLTFNDTANTLTRASGNFITEGFIVGMPVKTDSANANNKGPFKISAVSATSLTVTTTSGGSPSLTNGAETNVTVYGYSTTLTALATGGTEPYTYTWEISSGSLPPGLTLTSSGVIYGIPITQGTYSFTIKVSVVDYVGANIGYTIKAMSLTVKPYDASRSASYRIWVDIGTDHSGDDLPEDNKKGILQDFWEKAKWGMTDFEQVGQTVRIKVSECLGVNAITSFLNSIDGAVPSNVEKAPLAQAYYAIVNYFSKPSSTKNDIWNGGCGDPFSGDAVACRKNFILTISSAYDVSGGTTAAQYQSDCSVLTSGNASKKMVGHACYAFKTDLRDDSPVVGDSPSKAGTQNIYHFAVYTFGKDTESAINNEGTSVTGGRPANKTILADAAYVAGGAQSAKHNFYDASNGREVQQKLVDAITDILSQAASGTAVSVLTTSSRGIGSMVQAYFLPSKQDGLRDVRWTGYLQNLWIDPQDNLREDTVHDAKLKLAEDSVVRLFFDTESSETKAALFTTDADGNGGTLNSCSPTTKAFAEVDYLWEAGLKLAFKPPSKRTIFTAKKVINGTAVVLDNSALSGNTAFSTALSNDYKNLLNIRPTAPYAANDIIDYVRGVCKETGATGDAACGATANSAYRDRRLTLKDPSGSLVEIYNETGDRVTANENGDVWKLGDIISSTPKVFGNTPLNTYHIDYDDSTYYGYATSDGYKDRTSIAFVGGNDGMLHAFRVGYLKDYDIGDSTIKAIFHGLFSDNSTPTETYKLGHEVWGYIPLNSFPYLKFLADPDYCHVPYNDLTPRLIDVSLGCREDTTCDAPEDGRVHDSSKSSWRTLLIGGMSFGGACATGVGTPAGPSTEVIADSIGDDDGVCEPSEACHKMNSQDVGHSSYYAIDISNPESPVPLWEFSDPDMGYSTTYPSVVRTGTKDVNGNWYAVVGSGSTQLPHDSNDIARTSSGRIYLLNLKTGELVKEVILDHAAIVGDILAIDADKDYISEKIYFGTAYKDGSVWKGNVLAVDIPALLATSGMEVAWNSSFGKTLFTGDAAFTASPDSAKDSDGNVWVYIGSGKYYSDVDETDTIQQLFLGLKDKDTGITYPQTTSGLDNRTSTATTGTVTGTTKMCLYNDTANPPAFQSMDVVTSIALTSTEAGASTTGWYLNLMTSPTVERVISRPLAVGGLVDFLTYQPSNDVCAYGGSSYLYSVGYTTGVAPPNVAIRSPKVTNNKASGPVTVNKGILLGPGAPPRGEAIIIPPQKVGQEQLKKKIQIATGVIVETENKPAISTATKILHWLKK